MLFFGPLVSRIPEVPNGCFIGFPYCIERIVEGGVLFFFFER